MKNPMALRQYFILAFFTSLLFLFSARANAACVSVNETTHACAVTSERGDISDGSLIACLTDPRCQKITFNVGRVEPLKSLVEVAGGVQLDGTKPGGGKIELSYDTTYAWPAGTEYQSCLLRILPLPPTNSTAGATVSNLIITNQFGTGVCLLSQSGLITLGNTLTNLSIHVGGNGRGVDLSTSTNNRLTNVTIAGDGTRTTDGIYMSGSNNRINDGSITNFNYGVNVSSSTASGDLVQRVSFYSIRLPKPIRYSNGSNAPPANIRNAFVTSTQWVVTGTTSVSTDHLELYKQETASSGKNYIYKKTVPTTAIIRHTGTPYCLTADTYRFDDSLFTDQTDLRPADSVALIAQSVATSEFSAVYNGTSPIPGQPSCSQADWFWTSLNCDTVGHDGWHYDYDHDGLPNGGCSDPQQCEDLNQNCHQDEGESRPDDWTSQYDFDCDGRADNIYTGLRGVDNCPPGPHPLKPDGTAYTDADRLTHTCGAGASDPTNATRYTTWNPDQIDSDHDGLGDACETDPDNDGIPNGLDNCPTVYNPDQRNSDEPEDRSVMPPRIRTGDACKQMTWPPGVTPPHPARPDDADGDGRPNLRDNCPFDYNPDQTDTDGDGVGDACDFDIDNDGLANWEEDRNQNGIVDPGETDPKNPDSDFDGFCDGPGWGFQRIPCRPMDNCPLVTNRDQSDQDEDSIGDVCDAAPTQFLGSVDSDGDGVPDSEDNCPHIPNNTFMIVDRGTIVHPQQDSDLDGNGDACDSDDDNDGLDDATESGIYDPRRAYPNRDYGPRHLNNDSDYDGITDGVDVCPNLPDACENLPEGAVSCSGIIGNPTGDRSILPESRCGNYPIDDIDGDGIRNNADNCPFVPNRRQLDLDGDGKGDACDLDDDNDDNTDAEVDECRAYLQNHDRFMVDPILGATLPVIIARNRFGCNRALQECRTCDFDESANFKLNPWDPNSDHQGGMVASYADAKCDGGGTGFGFAGAFTRCEPNDPCPEFFNAPGSEGTCGPNAASLDIVAPDLDVDGVADANDNCKGIFNPDQADMNHNGVGDACDPDIDGDGIPNDRDNCPTTRNSDQTDTDGDGIGDACDSDPFQKNVAQIQGSGTNVAGGCSSMAGVSPAGGSSRPLLHWPLAAGLFILLLARSLLGFKKSGNLLSWIQRFKRFSII